MELPAKMSENYQLKWSSYTSFIHSCIASSLVNEDSFADVALMTMDGHKIMAHRFVLSYASLYFNKALQVHRKITSALPLMIVLPQSITYEALEILVKYMYSGEATVSNFDILQVVLTAGDILKIKGLYREDLQEDVDKQQRAPKLATQVSNPESQVQEPDDPLLIPEHQPIPKDPPLMMSRIQKIIPSKNKASKAKEAQKPKQSKPVKAKKVQRIKQSKRLQNKLQNRRIQAPIAFASSAKQFEGPRVIEQQSDKLHTITSADAESQNSLDNTTVTIKSENGETDNLSYLVIKDEPLEWTEAEMEMVDEKKDLQQLISTNSFDSNAGRAPSERPNVSSTSTTVLESDKAQIDDEDVFIEIQNDGQIFQLNKQLLPENLGVSLTDGFIKTRRNKTENTNLLPTIYSPSLNYIVVDVPDTKSHHNASECIWQLFEIPWSKIPQFMLAQCENGTADKRTIRQIIHTVVNEMRMVKTYIPNKAFQAAATKMAEKYPKVFLDTDEEGRVLGSGISIVVSQLQYRNGYLNRPYKRPGEYVKGRIPAKKLKALNNRKSGCSTDNWKPNSEEDITTSKSLINSINFDHPKFFELLEETYASQRAFLTNIDPPTAADIKSEWPILFTKEAILWHFKKLTEKDIQDNESKYLKIIAYGKQKQMTIMDGDETVLQALKILAQYFKEDVTSMFWQFKNTSPEDESIWNGKIVEPAVLEFELNEKKTYHVAIENQMVETKGYSTFTEAFQICFALFFNFGLKFPKDLSTTLEMIQRYILNDHPDSGTKSQKVDASKKKVIALIKKLKGFS